MTNNDADKLTVRLAQLFPNQMTVEQRKIAIVEFRKYERATVEAVLAGHRKQFEFINYPALFKACVAKEHEEESRARSMPDQSFADVIRKQWPALQDRGDVEVVLRFWRADWHRYKADADKRMACIQDHATDQRAIHLQNESGYKTKVLAGCAGALCGSGLTAEVAEKYVKTTVDPDVMYFRQVLEDVRDQFPAKPCAQVAAS